MIFHFIRPTGPQPSHHIFPLLISWYSHCYNLSPYTLEPIKGRERWQIKNTRSILQWQLRGKDTWRQLSIQSTCLKHQLLAQLAWSYGSGKRPKKFVSVPLAQFPLMYGDGHLVGDQNLSIFHGVYCIKINSMKIATNKNTNSKRRLRYDCKHNQLH